VNRYLIFRTDRIGDFLVTAILLKCIKKNDLNAHITLIASNSNLSYIKTFPYVNQVIPLNNNFLSNSLRNIIIIILIIIIIFINYIFYKIKFF